MSERRGKKKNYIRGDIHWRGGQDLRGEKKKVKKVPRQGAGRGNGNRGGNDARTPAQKGHHRARIKKKKNSK